jgi:hypothetical protein
MIIYRTDDRSPATLRPLLQIFLDNILIEVRASSAADRFSFEVAAGLGSSQLADRIAAQRTVLRAVTDEYPTIGQAV